MRTRRTRARRRRAGLALACAAAIPLAGCFGQFNAVRGVHGFNERVSPGEWQRSATFVAFNVVPVYPVAAIMDALLFNPIEFWTGSNPVDPAEIRAIPRNVTGRPSYATETASAP
jgi:hypothetical protein